MNWFRVSGFKFQVSGFETWNLKLETKSTNITSFYATIIIYSRYHCLDDCSQSFYEKSKAQTRRGRQLPKTNLVEQ